MAAAVVFLPRIRFNRSMSSGNFVYEEIWRIKILWIPNIIGSNYTRLWSTLRPRLSPPSLHEELRFRTTITAFLIRLIKSQCNSRLSIRSEFQDLIQIAFFCRMPSLVSLVMSLLTHRSARRTKPVKSWPPSWSGAFEGRFMAHVMQSCL